MILILETGLSVAEVEVVCGIVIAFSAKPSDKRDADTAGKGYRH
jgi:hypothetical protein